MIDHEIYKQYIKSHDKEVETLDEAIMIYGANCCGSVSCRECVRAMYSENCGEAKDKATKFIIEKISGYDQTEFSDAEFQRLMFNRTFESKPSAAQEQKSGTCAGCIHSQMHTSGILFCHSFGNFVHEGGFCYRWKSDKVEVEDVPLDTPKKAAPKKAATAVLDEEDVLELPF